MTVYSAAGTGCQYAYTSLRPDQLNIARGRFLLTKALFLWPASSYVSLRSPQGKHAKLIGAASLIPRELVAAEICKLGSPSSKTMKRLCWTVSARLITCPSGALSMTTSSFSKPMGFKASRRQTGQRRWRPSGELSSSLLSALKASWVSLKQALQPSR